MAQRLAQLWAWLSQVFGTPVAIVIVLVALVICLGWLFTPILVWRLYRKNLVMEQTLFEMRDHSASQGRQQQVERLRQDKSRTQIRRRRRR